MRPAGQEVINQPLYDTCHVGDLRTYNFFTNPIGYIDKTLSETNMVLMNKLPVNNRFLINGIKSYTECLTPYLEKAQLQLFIGNKIFCTVPFIETVMLGIKLSLPLMIVAQQNFLVTLTSDEFSKDKLTKTTIFLLGNYYRPIC